MARFYIGKLSHLTTEQELQAWIEQHGFKVESVQIIRDLNTGDSRGFAFVELPEVVRAQEAVDALDGRAMEEHNLRVSEARPLPQRDERHSPPKKRAS